MTHAKAYKSQNKMLNMQGMYSNYYITENYSSFTVTYIRFRQFSLNFQASFKNERKSSGLNLSNSTTSTVQLENQEGIALMIPPRPPAPSAGEPGGAGPRISTRAVAAGDTA